MAMFQSVDMEYAKSQRTRNPEKFDRSMANMNLQLKQLCNPWYVPAGISLGKYVLGLANPFKNNLPLVPWL